MRVERFEFDAKRKVTFTAYLQDVKDEFHFEKRPGMLVIPGGAYQHISRREQDSVAFAYLRAGYQVFLLSYGVKEACEWPSPLNDYEEAMALIEEKEEDIGLNYLANTLLEVCGAPKTEYYLFLDDMKKEVPFISAFGYKGKDGIWRRKGEESEFDEIIYKYSVVQYYRVFDKYSEKH